MLDDNFDAVSQIEAQRHAVWDYPAVLVERAAARSKASRSVSRGRDLEDQVEAVANVLGLAYELRTRFLGRGDDSAPADLAIPQGGRNAQIVIAVKGFDSTGSKLTDAVREIEAMASVRSPTQFVFAFIDGIGWLSRRKDVRAIYDLWLSNRIDGVYTVATLSKLEDALSAAKLRLDL